MQGCRMVMGEEVGGRMCSLLTDLLGEALCDRGACPSLEPEAQPPPGPRVPDMFPLPSRAPSS